MSTADIAWNLAGHAATTPFSAIPAATINHLARDLADSLGVCLGGIHAPGVPETRDVIGGTVRDGAATVFGTGARWPAAFAAQANATAGHALDFDDTLDEGGGMHAGVPVHVSALAIAEELGGITGAAYIGAVAIGLDIAVRLALAPSHDYGWHRTSAFGVFGATAAAGRLVGLDAERMRHALGIAYSQASGNRQCIADGALSKRLQSGFAARDAITAVRLAERGLTGATNIFEGANGFFPLYQRGGYDRAGILEGLGTDFLGRRISLKPYPCGRNLHAMIDAALAVRSRAQGRPIARVTIGLDRRSLETANRAYPGSVVEAQFSRAFGTALALAEGRLTIRAFDRPADASDHVGELFAITELEEWSSSDPGAVRVSVTYRDGGTDSEEASVARGHPTRPLPDADVRAKFFDCNDSSGPALPAGVAEQLFQTGLGITGLDDVKDLTRLLRSG